MLSVVRASLGYVPVSVSLGGRKQKIIMQAFDKLFYNQVAGKVKTKYGDINVVPEHDPQRFIAYCVGNILRGYEESGLGRYIRQKKLAGRSFVDVGANLGMYSLLAKAEGATVYVVEPEPSHVQFLQNNPHLYDHVLPVAFADHEDSLPIYHSTKNSGAGSLVPLKNFVKSETSVPVTSFSAMAAAGRLGKESDVALIKIDVEGFEVAAVRGLEAFLERGNRPDVWCEVRGNSARAPDSYKGVREIFLKHGYSCFDVSDTVPVVRPQPDDSVLSQRGVFDLLFVADPAAAGIKV